MVCVCVCVLAEGSQDDDDGFKTVRLGWSLTVRGR